MQQKSGLFAYCPELLFLPLLELNVHVPFQWPVPVEAARNRRESLSEPKCRVKASHARRGPYRSCNGESVYFGVNLSGC
jgi:hypothetical protein